MKIATNSAGLLLLLFCGLAQADWVVYGETKDGKVFSYDPNRVAVLSDGNIKVWYRETKSAQSKIADIESMARQLENMGAGGREAAMLARGKIPRYRNFSHTLSRTIFDCRRQKYFDEEFIDYSKDGSVLDSLNTNSLIAEVEATGIKVNSERFSEIYPGSVVEALMNMVCK